MDERARQDFAEFVAGRSAELLRLAYVLTADQHAAEEMGSRRGRGAELPAGAALATLWGDDSDR